MCYTVGISGNDLQPEFGTAAKKQPASLVLGNWDATVGVQTSLGGPHSPVPPSWRAKMPGFRRAAKVIKENKLCM
jgi:hypothetical protein